MATILTKRSNTASSVPVAGDLTNSSSGAELAVNTADKRLFTKDSGGTVVELGTNPSSLTLSGGTANGVAYLNGSKVLTTGSALQFDGSNLGLGVTPSAWGSNYKSLDIGTYGSFSANSGASTFLLNNVYNNGSNWVYKTNNAVGVQLFAANPNGTGGFAWLQAASGSAGATVSFTQAMTLDASGNLGVGTTNPSTYGKFGVIGTTSAGVTATFEGDSTYGAKIQFAQPGNTNFRIGIPANQDALAFYGFGGGTYPERARIDSSGNLLVGTTSSSATSGVGTKLISNGQYYGVMSGSTNADTTLQVYSTGAGAYRFYVGLGGTVYATSTTITGISDARLKENIRDLDEGLATVMALKPRKFDWKDGKGANIKNARGFIAQEFEQVLPDMIEEWKDSAPEGEEPYKAVNANLIPTLVKAIQELKAEFDAYKASHP